MKTYEVTEKVTLVVEKGSIVILSEKQGELASHFLKEVKQEKKKKEEK